jgi:uncharacterized protein
MRADVLLQQFARAPRPGEVKTRMQPQLSADESCELHRELVQWTCEQLVHSGMGEVELCVSGDINDELFQQCQAMGVFRVVQQQGEDLGERMYQAIKRGLQSYSKVILVGSDCPGINASHLDQAISALDQVPLVIGPAQDGGYVLIGATRIQPSLFRDIDWGSEQVLQQTLERCEAEQCELQLLPALADIDRPEDLELWSALRAGRTSPSE